MRRLIGPVALISALLVGVSVLLGPVSASFARAAPVPVVSPGGSLTLDVGGFARNSAVTVQLVGSSTGRRDAHADSDGRVHLSYRVPTVAGRYRLLLSGPARRNSSGPVSPPAAGPGDAQVIAVTVPRVISVPFRVGSSGVDAIHVHSGGSGSGSGGGTLSDTGIDVRTPLILAAALGLIGLVATVAGRRRARS